jgi:hypothetical protein
VRLSSFLEKARRIIERRSRGHKSGVKSWRRASWPARIAPIQLVSEVVTPFVLLRNRVNYVRERKSICPEGPECHSRVENKLVPILDSATSIGR